MMYTRLDDIPIFELSESQVDALHYNHVQVALKRLGTSIRYPLPSLKHLDLIIEKDAWIIVDRVLNDIPIAAWTDFENQHRDNLHEPIRCNLRLYHINAKLVLQRTLEAMELLLGEQLATEIDENNFHVIQFPALSPTKHD